MSDYLIKVGRRLGALEFLAEKAVAMIRDGKAVGIEWEAWLEQVEETLKSKMIADDALHQSPIGPKAAEAGAIGVDAGAINTEGKWPRRAEGRRNDADAISLAASSEIKAGAKDTTAGSRRGTGGGIGAVMIQNSHGRS